MQFQPPVASRRLPRLFDVAAGIRAILDAEPQGWPVAIASGAVNRSAIAVAWLCATHPALAAPDALAYVRCVRMGGPWPFDPDPDEVLF